MNLIVACRQTTSRARGMNKLHFLIYRSGDEKSSRTGDEFPFAKPRVEGSSAIRTAVKELDEDMPSRSADEELSERPKTHAGRAKGSDFFVTVGKLLKTAFATLVRSVGVWRDRAEKRRQLYAMTARDLKDIGISRVDARREAKKPFWRP